MLTPAFEIRQDENTVFLTIKAPYTNIKNCDIYVNDNEVKFFSEPYFLRLNLPGNVVENGNSAAKYDADSGHFHLTLPKETPGQNFEDLQLLTKLLAPKLKPGQSAIEEIDDVSDEDLDDEDGDIWQVNQTAYDDTPSLQGRSYGFNRSKTGVIQRMKENFPHACDIQEPEVTSVQAAREQRLAQEKEKFDLIHYLSDYFDEEEGVKGIMNQKIDYTEECEFSEEDNAVLAKMPPRKYVMDKAEKLHALLGLVDLVYAYAYTNRINGQDWNCECGWTVAKVSATLSHFEEFTSFKSVMNSCFRRTLVYPLFRNFDVASQCWQDSITIFSQGANRVLKCLLTIYKALEDDDDGRYILNELYVSDYIIWLQRQCKPHRLGEIAERMSKVEINKEEIGLGIVELEQAADKLLVEGGDAQQRPEEPVSDLDSDDDVDSDSSTSAHDSDDYHSDEDPDSSDESSSDESDPSEPSSIASAASTNRTL